MNLSNPPPIVYDAELHDWLSYLRSIVTSSVLYVGSFMTIGSATWRGIVRFNRNEDGPIDTGYGSFSIYNDDDELRILSYNSSGTLIGTTIISDKLVVAIPGETPEVIGSTNYTVRAHILGAVQAYGYACRQGYGATIGTNAFNFNWTGAALNAYADNTLLGAVTLTSDYRLKQDVRDLDVDALARIKKLRPISFRWKNVDIFKDDGKTREGFVAHEIGEAIPGASVGDKDGNDGKKDQYQYIDIMQLFPTIVKGIQELTSLVETQARTIEDLQKRVEQLEKKQP